MERERVPKNWGIVTERIQKVFVGFVDCAIKGGDVKELNMFRAAASCVSGGGVGVN